MKQSNLFQKIEQNKKARLFIRLGFILLWIIVWQIAALLVNLPIFFPTPIEVVKKLFNLIATCDYWQSIGNSMIRIITGYFIGLSFGLILAIVCTKSKILHAFISPVMHFFKTVPVACFVILILIWFTSQKLSVIIGIIMVTPVIFGNLYTAIIGIDKKFLDMAKIHRLSRIRTIRYIYFPLIYPQLKSSLKLSISLCFKAAIAAELIGIPKLSIGEMLHDAKIYIEADVLFAWTLTIIFLSYVTGKILKLILYMIKLAITKTPSNKKSTGKNLPTNDIHADNNHDQSSCALTINNLCKSYDKKLVLNDYNLSIAPGERFILSNPSGWGKTTLINIILGITSYDSGKLLISPTPVFSCLFQEDRLIDSLSGLCNIAFVSGVDTDLIYSSAALIGLSREDLKRPVCKLSGGQKRRVSILRALLNKHNFLILDEPFTGLDENTIILVNDLISTDKSTKLIISHID